MLVGFSGSRSIRDEGIDQGVIDLLAYVVSRNHQVAVGDAIGVDSDVIQHLLLKAEAGEYDLGKLSIFCVGGFNEEGDPSGFWKDSMSTLMLWAAKLAGANVIEYAGGENLQVSVISRLKNRSKMMVESIMAEGGILVSVFGPGRTNGTLNTLQLAAGHGVKCIGYNAGRRTVFPIVAGHQWVPFAESLGVPWVGGAVLKQAS